MSENKDLETDQKNFGPQPFQFFMVKKTDLYITRLRTNFIGKINTEFGFLVKKYIENMLGFFFYVISLSFRGSKIFCFRIRKMTNFRKRARIARKKFFMLS